VIALTETCPVAATPINEQPCAYKDAHHAGYERTEN
jgi:hypothetical protein